MRIKDKPEDFFVKEEITLSKSGNYYVYSLTKSNIGTQEAITKLEKKLNCKFSHCGNKDKIAITEQFVSTKKKSKETSIEGENFWIKLEFAGMNSEPLSLGSHEKNYFEIKIRNLEVKPFKKKSFSFPNYFGEQRFSTKNVEVGKLLLERKFKEACELVDDKKVKEHLRNNPTDFFGALKNINKKILRLYLTSVQSEEFNKELSKKISGKILLVAKQELKFAEFESKEKIVMKGWDSGDRRFLFKEYSELSLEGAERNASATAENVVFDGKIIKFFLPKGSYATIFLRSIFLEDINYC